MFYHTEETVEEATHRLNCVVADQLSTIIQLKKRIKDLEADCRAKKIKLEPMDPVSLIKKEPESDTGELHVCTPVTSDMRLTLCR